MKGSGRQRRGGASHLPTIGARTEAMSLALRMSRASGKQGLAGEGEIAKRKAVSLPKLRFLEDRNSDGE